MLEDLVLLDDHGSKLEKGVHRMEQRTAGGIRTRALSGHPPTL